MNREEFLALRNQLPGLRQEVVESNHGRIPKSIARLEAALLNVSSRDDKAALYTLILSECSYFRSHELSIHFLRQQVLDLRDDPFALTSLATGLAEDERTHDEALLVIGKAVGLAKNQNRQVRYSLTCQARVALQIGDYRLFNEALRGLIEDAQGHKGEDHPLEFDFLDQADQDKADRKLIAEYRSLSN